VRLGATLAEVSRDGAVRRLRLSDGAAIEADEILVAAGRLPNVEELGLEAAGVETRREGVVVDDFLRTTNRRIFAAGDVALAAKFTHAADAAARVVIQNALFAGRKRFSAVVVPWSTYTDPEVAHVGLGAAEAAARGAAVATLTVPFDEVDRARLEGDPRGFLRVHAEAASGRVLGATVVGRHAGDLVAELATAIAGRMGLADLAAVVHPYPTRAEAVRKAGDAWNRRRLTPRTRRLLGAWLRLRFGRLS
jgi:pyruvate/2-oxoglutarate dehydrogenase complex dihydrolipoamide dehydrogenase (E3) component